MKKIVCKAGAIILAFLLFFNSIFIQSVYAIAPIVVWVISSIASTALGYAVTEVAIKPIAQDLGWSSADIQVDENGNVILSEAQMQELKDILEEYTQDSNGNDKYGMFLFTGSYKTLAGAMQGASYNLDKQWNIDWLENEGHYGGWVSYSPSSKTGHGIIAPSNAIWIIPDNAYGNIVTFYNQNGRDLYPVTLWDFDNGDRKWYTNGTTSTSLHFTTYGGPGHYAFHSIASYLKWKEDGSPYTLTAPTYTGGDLVIPKDQLQNPDNNPTNPDSDFDDDGNPVTEKGWLARIYDRLGDILNQIKQIKWLTVADVVINALDTFGEGIGNVVGAVVDSVSAVFPLCIAWDFVYILNIFVAEPAEPIFTIPLKYEPIGLDVTFTIDLTDWEWAVKMFRVFELLAFIAGLFELTVAWVGKGDDV